MTGTSLPIETTAPFGRQFDDSISQMTSDHQMVFFGARRSGIHALTIWLLTSYPSPRAWANSLPNRVTRPKLNLRESPTHVNFSLLGFEDPNRGCSLEAFLGDAERTRERYGSADRATTVCVLRDLYNNIASRVRASQDHGEVSWGYHGVEDIRIWREMAEWCVANPESAILYNQWHTDGLYRATVRDRFSLPRRGITDRVSNLAFGSSFDKTAHDKTPQYMKVLTRWKQVDMPKEVFNSSLAHLNEQLFGWSHR